MKVEAQVVLDSLCPGSVLASRYEILQVIGRGGMSSVYKAADKLTGDILALKVMPSPDINDETVLESFRQEVVLARKLSHANVVRIYDIGTDGPTRFISMELIDGRDLAFVLEEKDRLDNSTAFSILNQLWSALDYIHSNRIIHRDIKLRNLMLARDGTLKLMDFGIALELGKERNTTIWTGTPGYIAPEVTAGQPPSTSSDIYAAGIVCEQVIGRTANIPLEIKTLITSCIDADPEKRPESASSVLTRISAILKGVTPPMASTRRFSDVISQDPAHADLVVPLMTTIARVVAALPPEQTALSPRSIRINSDGTVEIESAANVEAKYSAPELFQEGVADDVRAAPAARTYSLGFMFFELLAGRHIFEKHFEDVLRNGQDLAWFEWHGNLEKTLPALQTLVPECPPGISDLVDQMSRKRVAERLTNLSEVADRLGALGTSFEHTVVQKIPKARPPFWSAGKILVVSTLLSVAALYGSWVYWPHLWFEVIGIFLKHDEPLNAQAEPVHPSPEPVAPPVTEPEPPPPSPPPPPLLIDTSTGPMVWIPEGELVMGNNEGRKSRSFGYENEFPAHQVHVAAFYLDATEVTNAAYAQFCNSPAHSCPANPPWDPEYFTRLDYPVMNVSWSDAEAFCRWAGKSLPSEAQWERAARGDDNLLLPWGNEKKAGNANLKGSADGFAYAAPVGSFSQDRSPFGVLDLAGNLPEWTADTYSLYPGNSVDLPEEERSHRVIRGGGFMMDVELARATNRASASPVIRDSKTLQVGFRCAADANSGMPLAVKR